MRTVVAIFYAITIVSTMVGTMIALIGVHFAVGAPQEASAAAVGIACGVLPYVFTRSFQCLMSLDRQYDTVAYLKVIAERETGQTASRIDKFSQSENAAAL